MPYRRWPFSRKIQLLGVIAAGFVCWQAWHVGGLWAEDAAKPVVAAKALADKKLATTASDRVALESRLAEHARYLASDELEGRGMLTDGINKAADYLAAQFADAGLQTNLIDGGPFQTFPVVSDVKPGKRNRAMLVGPAGDDGEPQTIRLRLNEDFEPLGIGMSGRFDAPVVFVGYGITGPHEGYDDYAGIDVEGKVVVVLRKEPEQGNPDSVFNGDKPSLHATFQRKLSNAYEHGAAAVIFCNDLYDLRQRVEKERTAYLETLDEIARRTKKLAQIDSDNYDQLVGAQAALDELLKKAIRSGEKLAGQFDPLLGFGGAGMPATTTHMPVIFARRRPLDRMVQQALGKDLARLEHEIDQGPTPQSRELPGWRLVGEVTVERNTTQARNVLAKLPGVGPLADEVIVIGAHYDHLGRGETGSLARGSTEIHNGADDNASGAAALLEVARLLAEQGPLPRTVLFIAFSGEERGLLGSDFYCGNPIMPLENTVAMLNMDMVGRLTDEKLIVNGVDTGNSFATLLDELNEQFEFDLRKKDGGFGPSDHASFYARKIPVLHFFTDLHSDYHRPSDDFDKLNITGMGRVTLLVAEMATRLATADDRPEYVASARPTVMGGGNRPYFGSIPDFAQAAEGYGISGVAKDSPADKGGLQGGDLIIRLGDSRISGLEDFDNALRKYKAGDKVEIIVRRDGEEKKLEVVLEAPR